MYFDTHAHLDDVQFAEDLDQVISNASKNKVNLVLNVGITLKSSRRSIKLAEKYPGIYASVGIHPHDAKAMTQEKLWAELEQLATMPKVVALGEMGLDYYRNHSEPDVQRKVFRQQLEMAKKLGLPVIIHDRDAHQDVLDILKSYQGQVTGVLHCFSGSWEMARECVEMGFYISLGGPVTFTNAVKPKEVATKIPLEKLMIETDCPYLTPHPHRGKRNEPSYVTMVAQEIARLRGLEIEDVAAATRDNGIRLFNKIKSAE